LSSSELFKSSACRSPSAHALPSLRPTPPNKYALVPTTVNVCPERGSGGVPFRGAGSHVTDCEGGKRGQARPAHRVGIDRSVALVVDGRVGRGRRAPDAATSRPKRDCLSARTSDLSAVYSCSDGPGVAYHGVRSGSSPA
jgi:hypothetical protein